MSLRTALRGSILILASLPLVAADPTLMRMVPAEAKTIAGIDLGRSSASPFGQFLLSRMQNEDQSFRDFVTATGFDPRRDLREVLLVSLDPADKSQGLVLARGTFDIPRILAHASKHGAETMRMDGIDLIGKSGERGGWIALLDSSTALAGTEPLVKTALGLRKSGSQLDAKLVSRINDFSARYDAWLVSTVPVGKFAGAVPDKQVAGAMQANAMQGIEQVNGGVKFGELVEIAGEAITRSEKDAQALVDVVRFLSGMVQMNSKNAPEAERLAKLLQSLDLKTSGSSVLMMISVPETELEKLILEGSRSKPQRRASV